MSPRARAAKPSVSSSKSKKQSSPIDKKIRRSPANQSRPKRLSSLTAATLLQYCTSILSPRRKLKKTSNEKATTSKKRQISENPIELPIATRARREASSHASAMIMQQNEIERSRRHYSSTSIQRHRSKNKDDPPPPPSSSVNVPVKYPLLTEEILAEHNRLQETITTKNDNLLKWTDELARCGRLSPPYPVDEIPVTKEINPSILLVNNSTSLSSTSNVSAPTFLFPSSGYSLDLRSFYPLMPCWQYPSWPFQSTTYRSLTHSDIRTKKSSKLDSSGAKKDTLAFHLHTHHHHHHHHNSKSSSLIKTIQPLGVHNALTQDEEPMSPTIENEVLNLSIEKATRRKSSPVKRSIITRTKSNSSTSSVRAINPLAENPIRRVLKRRSASAAVVNSPTLISTSSRTSRGKRTISATARKRSYSPTSVSLPLSHSRSKKKQKTLHNWILFGRSEQKLVSLDADKPPVFRECYSSIRHITEKDVIKSNDCVILRSETGEHHGAAPYLAKVKWFWEEATTGDIQMSLIWFYHPEHTELPLRIRERFLPNELLASKYWDSVSVACIEDKCYVLTFNEYNRYCLREQSVNLFEHSPSVGQLKYLLNKTPPIVQHRPLPGKTVSNQNIFFCRYVYDYRAKRVLKNPTLFSM